MNIQKMFLKILVLQLFCPAALWSVSPEDVLKGLGLAKLIECHLSEDRRPAFLTPKTDVQFHLLRDPFIDIVVSQFCDQAGLFQGTEVQKANLINLIEHAQTLEQHPDFKLAIRFHKGFVESIKFFKLFFETNLTAISILISNPRTVEQDLKNIVEIPFNQFIIN